MDEIGQFGGKRMHIPKERDDFAPCLLRRGKAFPGCENVQIPKGRYDFVYSVLRRRSAHSLEKAEAEKCRFRRKLVTFLLACSGEKVRFPDAKKCTFRRKGVILPTACCGGKVHIHRKVLRRKSAHSEGMV